MRLLAINGSPRGRTGNTDVLVQAFLDGARDGGGKTEMIYLADKRINHCAGCFTCWTGTPGRCIHEDDMPEILERIQGADVLVYGMPLYIYTVPGLMKDFMDRMIPLALPTLERRGDHYIHPPRTMREGKRRAVLVSNAGFSSAHHFDGLKRTFELFTEGPDSELVGSVCCAAGPLLGIPAMRNEVQWYVDATTRAGREVVERGRISEETQAVLDGSLAPDSAVYAEMANRYWHTLGAESHEAHAAEGRSSVSRASLARPVSLETVQDLIAGMPDTFNRDTAGDLSAVIQFEIIDEEPGSYHIAIENGSCRAFSGKHQEPSMTIHTPADVWMSIAKGELTGQAAFMKGLYRVEGDFGLLMRMNALFSPESAVADVPPPTPAEETVQRGPLKLGGMTWLALAFSPWIGYWIMQSIPGVPSPVALGGPLLVGLLLLVYRTLYARPTWMEIGTPIWFAVAGGVTAFGSSAFNIYGNVLSSLALAALWGGTLLTRTPLTAHYSKWSWPPAIWMHPVFTRTNAVITAYWTGTYVLQAVVGLLAHSMPELSGLWIGLRYGLLIPAYAFTVWFQRWYPARATAK
ncbi:MAG: NAD(P)H-dependent oxidoreductase [Candidatus Bipolaricaulia bacterium]